MFGGMISHLGESTQWAHQAEIGIGSGLGKSDGRFRSQIREDKTERENFLLFEMLDL